MARSDSGSATSATSPGSTPRAQGSAAAPPLQGAFGSSDSLSRGGADGLYRGGGRGGPSGGGKQPRAAAAAPPYASGELLPQSRRVHVSALTAMQTTCAAPSLYRLQFRLDGILLVPVSPGHGALVFLAVCLRAGEGGLGICHIDRHVLSFWWNELHHKSWSRGQKSGSSGIPKLPSPCYTSLFGHVGTDYGSLSDRYGALSARIGSPPPERSHRSASAAVGGDADRSSWMRGTHLGAAAAAAATGDTNSSGSDATAKFASDADGNGADERPPALNPPQRSHGAAAALAGGISAWLAAPASPLGALAVLALLGQDV